MWPGFSPRSTAPPAPSAQLAGRRGHPRGAVARQPAPVGRACDAQRGHARGCVAGDQPQRPAQRLELDRDAITLRLKAHESRGDAVVTRRATLLQVADRLVGGAHVLGRRLEVILPPVGGHRVQRPRSSRKDSSGSSWLSSSSADMRGRLMAAHRRRFGHKLVCVKIRRRRLASYGRSVSKLAVLGPVV